MLCSTWNNEGLSHQNHAYGNYKKFSEKFEPGLIQNINKFIKGFKSENSVSRIKSLMNKE